MTLNQSKVVSRKATPRSDISGPPPEEPPSAPIRELHPTMDARFILVEIGKLMNQGEANTRLLEKLGDKVSAMDDTIKTTKLIGKIIIVIFSALVGLLWWICTILWPMKDKILSVFSGS